MNQVQPGIFGLGATRMQTANGRVWDPTAAAAIAAQGAKPLPDYMLNAADNGANGNGAVMTSGFGGTLMMLGIVGAVGYGAWWAYKKYFKKGR